MGPFKYLLGDYGDVKWKKKMQSAISQVWLFLTVDVGPGITVSLKIAASFPYKYLY